MARDCRSKPSPNDECSFRLRDLDETTKDTKFTKVKAVERLDRIHQAQLLFYMKAGRFKVGLLMNFHSENLKSSLRRFVL